MIKQVLGISMLGFLIASGCSRGPMREQTDDSLPLSNAPPIHLSAALAQAKADHRLVLLDFTGSDWCPPCIELKKNVFSQPASSRMPHRTWFS